MGRSRPARAYVLLLLFLYDWIARDAHDHRNRPPYRPHTPAAPCPVHPGILCAARSERPLLALRRHHLDFSLSATLSNWRALHRGWTLMSEHIVPVKLYLGIFVALLCLTALTTGVAYIDLGAFNTVAALAIAVVKMLLVVLFFMHVKYSGRLIQVFILAGVLFLAILVTFTLADEMTRHWSPTPSGWGMLVPLLSHFF